LSLGKVYFDDSQNQNLLIYKRELDDKIILVIANIDSKEVSVDVSSISFYKEKNNWKDLLTNRLFNKSFTLKPYEVIILN